MFLHRLSASPTIPLREHGQQIRPEPDTMQIRSEHSMIQNTRHLNLQYSCSFLFKKVHLPHPENTPERQSTGMVQAKIYSGLRFTVVTQPTNFFSRARISLELGNKKKTFYSHEKQRAVLLVTRSRGSSSSSGNGGGSSTVVVTVLIVSIVVVTAVHAHYNYTSNSMRSPQPPAIESSWRAIILN